MTKYFISLTLKGTPVKVNTMAGSLSMAIEKVKKLYPIAKNLRMVGTEKV
jgi:hypothetical protein